MRVITRGSWRDGCVGGMAGLRASRGMLGCVVSRVPVGQAMARLREKEGKPEPKREQDSWEAGPRAWHQPKIPERAPIGSATAEAEHPTQTSLSFV